MSLDFSESLTIELPRLGEEYNSHKESTTETGLIVEIAAIHEGLTSNYNFYGAKELKKSLDTWVSPYPRPVITNHDQLSETLGRIMAAKIVNENDLTTIMLQAAIGDAIAIEKFRDKRYLTGSVGGKAEQAICNICGTDWAKAPAEGRYMPCDHRRGQLYKGKLAWLEMKGINWKEYSMVNTPADAQSGVRDTGTEDSDDGWVKAQLYSVNMNKESIVQFGESGSTDILVGKKRKEAVPLYHNIRGAFLSAFVAESEEEVTKETEVSDAVENDDDILSVMEGLEDETPVAEDVDNADDAVADDAAADDAVAADEDAVEAPADSEDTDADAPEAADEASEDVEADAPEAEADADAADESATEAPEASDAEEPTGEADDSQTSDSDEADAAAELDASQERITALEAEITALTEENGKLRSALKKGLAERVVDMKINLGHESAEDRSSLIEEHATRSASSLADSLVDLRKTVGKGSVEEAADLFNGKSGTTGVKSDTKVTTSLTEAEERKVTPSEKLEDILAQGLLGKRAL